VHPDAPVAQAARRIALGKLFNAGQTCIAPDFALIPHGTTEAFVEAFADAVQAAGPTAQETSIISDRAHARLRALLAEAESTGARIVPCGADGEGRRMAPVLVLGAPRNLRLWSEEIFGPILPVAEYDDFGQAVDWIRAMPRPLAMYLFDPDVSRARATLARIPSGGASINDTLAHFAQENLPFGGISASGMGAYHGKAGFDAFSHRRGVVAASSLSPARRVMAPPYRRAVKSALTALIGPFGRVLG
jgi:acyl-CoA reductase-like NAD-dependent aldehyde dehydrogenase